jgi:hypothetical protein
MNYSRAELCQQIIERRLKLLQSSNTILRWLQDELKYSEPMAYDHLRFAQKEIHKIYAETNATALSEAIGQLESQMEDAKNTKQYKLAFNIRQEISKLQGLMIEKKDITSGGEKLGKMIIEIVNVAGHVTSLENNSNKLENEETTGLEDTTV